MKRINKKGSILALVIASLGVISLSTLIGPVSLQEISKTIFLELRLPRPILSFLVGASLGTAGVIFQGIFRNPLADPFVVGVSGGAGLGAVVAFVLGWNVTLLGLGASSLFAFGGALGAAFLAYRISNIGGRVPVGSLLLAGFAIGAFTGAVVSLLLILNRNNWNEVIAWLMGNMEFANPLTRIWVVLPFLLISFTIAMLKARHLNLLLFGEDQAQTLGVDAEKSKRLLLFAGSIAAAAAVATCGIIGFVGLIVPHIVRNWVGPDHRILLPISFLAGGFLLTLADVASRLISSTPLPIGAVTALFGAPFFLYLLRRKSIRF